MRAMVCIVCVVIPVVVSSCGSAGDKQGSKSDFQTAKALRGPQIDFLTPHPIGDPGGADPAWITHAVCVDLDGNGLQDVVFSDARLDQVCWIVQAPAGVYTEQALGDKVSGPTHITPCDIDKDGDLDLLVAKMGTIFPSTDKVGGVVVLENDGHQTFTNRVLVDNIARVTDVEPGDLDGDGDLDLAVGQFGYEIGEIRWMENMGHDWEFHHHLLLNLSGTIHTPVADIDQDGDLDVVALVSQEWEEIYVFENDGAAQFKNRMIYGSSNEDFGSSGIELVDMDVDGDLDILYTNGDSFDYLPPGPRPWHGLQWLENKGALQFDYHRIDDFAGAASAVGVDVDRDDDIDIVAVSSLGQTPDSKDETIIWYENDGRMRFVRHPIATSPSHLIVIAPGDMNGDGWIDFVTGGLYAAPPYDRLSRIHLWTNSWPNRSESKSEAGK